MKYISLVLSLAGISMAKVCGNITVSSQLDIDNQDATDCTVIDGDLVVLSDFPGHFNLNVIVVTGNVIARNLNSVTLVSIPAMAAVGGNLELTGSFFTPSFPSLWDVHGDFKVLSVNEIYCSNFDYLVERRGVRGTFECREGVEVSPAEVGLKSRSDFDRFG
ncbi:cell wall protein Ecm33 [Aspergillus melleus]|uniref:Cell wall protein Ecm33 n=1 Tax=Aspergillus melleus TaxID=138277 RepID=A0ACC3BA69_9EURO|nr:cell wall protein Ecm33 [Aspergillus melleus]